MSIATRFIRLWKSDLHGVMESLEDKGLLLKQCLREMQDDLESREAVLNRQMKKKEKAVHDQKSLQQENTKVEKDLEASVSMGKDDICRFLIKKKFLVERHLKEVEGYIRRLEQDILNGQEDVTARRTQYEQTRLRSMEYIRSKENEEWDNMISAFVPTADGKEPSDEEIELELLKRKRELEAVEKEVDHA